MLGEKMRLLQNLFHFYVYCLKNFIPHKRITFFLGLIKIQNYFILQEMISNNNKILIKLLNKINFLCVE